MLLLLLLLLLLPIIGVDVGDLKVGAAVIPIVANRSTSCGYETGLLLDALGGVILGIFIGVGDSAVEDERDLAIFDEAAFEGE